MDKQARRWLTKCSGVKAAGHEADDSPPFIADAKNGGAVLPPYLTLPYPPMGRRALSPEVKQQEHEANHSPPTCAEVKNTWICTSTTPYIFMA
jgi:hypothetical protein